MPVIIECPIDQDSGITLIGMSDTGTHLNNHEYDTVEVLIIRGERVIVETPEITPLH